MHFSVPEAVTLLAGTSDDLSLTVYTYVEPVCLHMLVLLSCWSKSVYSMLSY